MALVSTKEMLADAVRRQYAVAAFNVENLEMIQTVLAQASQMHAPVILQTTPSTLRYATVNVFHSMVQAQAEKLSIPVALHLDHGDCYELCCQALRAGYTSIMRDGSHESLERNIALTREVVRMCEPCGVPVEGELGRVGGKEDDTVSDAVTYTNPAQAALFARETGVSSLAIGVGTAHGVYASKPVLSVETIRQVRRALPTLPLVLHGASGLEDESIAQCIAAGMNKVNFATELRQAYTAAVADYLHTHSAVFDPKKYGEAARQAVARVVARRILICGSQDRF